jgi:hypothetical protein
MHGITRRGITVGALLTVLVVLGQGELMAEAPELGANLFWEDSNDARIPILPNGQTTLGEIPLHGAPPAAIVARMDVQVSIVHPNPGKLSLRLTDQAGAYGVPIGGRMDGDAFEITFSKTGIDRFNGEEVNQRWRLNVQDDSGTAQEDRYIDSWRVRVFYAEPNAPSNNEPSRAIRLFARWPYCGWVYGADGQDLTTAFAGDTADVWHEFIAPQSREYAISLRGSAPNRTLGVFDSVDAQTELACGEAAEPEVPANLQIPMIQGRTYVVRVAGLPRTNGNYVLCISPVSPIDPYPGDGQVNVPADGVLSWDGFPRPPDDARNGPSALITVSSDSPPGSLRASGIYGSDDRQDEYEVQNPSIVAAGDSTVALVDPSDLIAAGNNTFLLSGRTLAEAHSPLCPDEPYANQPCVAKCSGFLVAPDVIATAGHCAVCKEPDCISKKVAVFGFALADAGQTCFEIPEGDVYPCREIIASRYAETDWALIRLNREVAGHIPLRVRRKGTLSIGEPLLLIGHPVGLPRKYVLRGTVRANDLALSYFEANLDSFGGNSGGVVLNAALFNIEGINVSGPMTKEFVEEGGCYRSVRCLDKGCNGRNWQHITRASEFANLIPAFEVYLGTDPDAMTLAGDGLVLPTFDPGRLHPQTTYYWQVVATGGCGPAQSPVWSFTTAGEGGDGL